MKTKGGIGGLVILVILGLVVLAFFTVDISPKEDRDIYQEASEVMDDLSFDPSNDLVDDVVDDVAGVIDDVIPDKPEEPIFSDELTIANWNLQIFGKSKASRPEVMSVYADTLDNYDIAIVQEIRDGSGTAFESLCDMVSGTHECIVSHRAGRTISKEQYGVMYNSKVEVLNTTDLWSQTDKWERPPFIVKFKVNDWIFNLVTIHTKPDDVSSELVYLDNYTSSLNNSIVVIGDLNADCNYYDTPPVDFIEWYWVIPDDADTTVAQTDCAYDRIIVNTDNVLQYGIEEFASGYSDHYLVWAEFDI